MTMRVTGIGDNASPVYRKFEVEALLTTDDGTIMPIGFVVARELHRTFDALNEPNRLKRYPLELRGHSVIINGSKVAAPDYQERVIECLEREPLPVEICDEEAPYGSMMIRANAPITHFDLNAIRAMEGVDNAALFEPKNRKRRAMQVFITVGVERETVFEKVHDHFDA